MLSKQNVIIDTIKHFFPIVIAIAIFEIISIQIYQHSPINLYTYKFFVWKFAQAIGGFALGYLSDKHCRKRLLFISQLFGAILFYLIINFNFDIVLLLAIGLLFNPSPIARAALVDNFPKTSKVKLISITYIAQFIPWCFYFYFSLDDNKLSPFMLSSILFFNSLITYFLFEDRKDLSYSKNDNSKKPTFHKQVKIKTILTLIALFPSQLVFFISDTFFEELSTNAQIFSALGLGSLFGVMIGVCYRKTPHIALITFCYGMGLLLSSMPILSSFYGIKLNGYYQIIIFSSLGGFYLPFIFDVILSSVSVKYRGAACGMIELIISVASIIGIAFVLAFRPSESGVFIFSSFLFLMAIILQKRGEYYEYINKN